MHNGGIAEFGALKRRLQQDLPDVAFHMVQGNTGAMERFIHLRRLLKRISDSEWCFALLLSKVSRYLVHLLNCITPDTIDLAPRSQRKLFYARSVAESYDGHNLHVEQLCKGIQYN